MRQNEIVAKEQNLRTVTVYKDAESYDEIHNLIEIMREAEIDFYTLDITALENGEWRIEITMYANFSDEDMEAFDELNGLPN